MHPMPYTDSEKQRLLQIARGSIQSGLESGKPSTIDLKSVPDALKEKRATFVTLHRHDELRGCIGALTAHSSVAEEIAQNAYAAAFQDHRFTPVETQELDDLDISISVLTPSEPLEFKNEVELLEKIHPGIDGLILESRRNRGVFLPSVWESLPDRKQFLNELKRKAGLPLDYWSDEIRVSCFSSEYFSEDSI